MSPPPAAALRPPPVQRAARLPPAPLPRRPGQLREQRRREAAAALRPAVPGPFPSRQRPAAFSDTRRGASGRRRHLHRDDSGDKPDPRAYAV